MEPLLRPRWVVFYGSSLAAGLWWEAGYHAVAWAFLAWASWAVVGAAMDFLCEPTGKRP